MLGHHQRGLGVAAADHAAVTPEELHGATLGHRRLGDDGGHELHPLAADPRHEQLTFQDALLRTVIL